MGLTMALTVCSSALTIVLLRRGYSDYSFCSSVSFLFVMQVHSAELSYKQVNTDAVNLYGLGQVSQWTCSQEGVVR